MSDEKAIVPIIVEAGDPAERAERDTASDPRIGDWFWITSPDDQWGRNPEKTHRWLGCVIAVGSNYVEFDGPGHREERIHINELDARIKPAPDAEAHIAGKIELGRKNVALLMGEVQEITAKLMITMGPKAIDGGGSETAALALRGDGEPIEKYKKSLAKAKDKELPKLFSDIEGWNKHMAIWMQAPLIPLKAEAEQMKPAIKAIESRIFNVELYAGLCEEVMQIADGKPAAMHEKVHLFQRRHYMDEECLANYETGGMTFKTMKAFYAWLVKPENMTRILPMPRCIVAFQVRRKEEDRRDHSWRDFIAFALGGTDPNKYTYLFIRNGEKVWVLSTGIEFGANLFPDIDQQKLLTGQIYAKDHGRGGLISEHQYKQMVIDENAEKARIDLKYDVEMKEYNEVTWPAHEAEMVKYRAALKNWETDFPEEAAKKAKGEKQKSSWRFRDYDYSKEPEKPDAPHVPYKSHFWGHAGDYEPWTKDSVYYDDTLKHVEAEINRHNRLVVVLQGLFDRSEILHPHRPVQLWTQEGFEQNLALVYDDSRALVSGDAPDFEAFRRKLNASITKDSVLVGQDDYWARKEAEKLNKKKKDDENHRERFYYRPHTDPGPGVIAVPDSLSKKGLIFTWTKTGNKRVKSAPYKRPGHSGMWTHMTYPEVSCSITVPVKEVLNISAYTPGDYKQFYNDPRTRAEYMQWAGYLLRAEEFHAGNKKYQPKPKSEPKEIDE